MKINTLELTNVRGFIHAKLEFQPGFNLIVGINGVGKTTVLETLRMVLSHILTELSMPIITRESLKKSDININSPQLQVDANFTFDENDYSFTYSQSAKDFVTVNTEQKKRTRDSTANVREEGITLKDNIVFKPAPLKTSERPQFGLFFSTRRSLIVNQTSKAVNSKLPYAAAYVEALSENRAFNIKMFAEWFKVRKELAKATPKHDSIIKLIEKAIYTFLPDFSDLDIVEDEITKELTFCITKANKVLNFTQLSDGERGMLALVFDISRRLVIANADIANPLEGEAVILIDELDLHLHPKWQRTIVIDLERTFPNCQFIATTHSPQIISSVLPQNIQIIRNFETDQTIKSFGLDINWILKFIMEDSDRLKESEEAIAAVKKLVDNAEFEQARALIDEYKTEHNLDLQEWIMFEAQMSHLEMFGDEEDN